VPISRAVLGARPKIYARRESDPIQVLEVTVNDGETVDEACLRIKKAAQAKLEEAFGKTRNSSDVQNY
jgi:hypothetical protein